jgi:hypothetical protein
MGITGGQPHIPPQGLNERTYASLHRATWRLERRSAAGTWTVVGIYGDEPSAAQALDEAVGEGRGSAVDYRLTRVRPRVPWVAIGVGAIIVIALVIIAVVTFG